MDIKTIFEEPFDYEAYLESRLREIDDLEERSFARAFLKPALTRMFAESEKNYQRLEERVYAEITTAAAQYAVYLTVMPKQAYDITNGIWFPVLEEDRKSTEIAVPPAQQGSSFPVGSVFWSGGMEQGRQLLLDTGREFDGVLLTDQGEVQIRACLAQDQRYLQAVEQLYQIFLVNNVPWTTLPCGYLFRFWRVQANLLGETLKPGQKVTGFKVDFAEQAPWIELGQLPVWNLQKIAYDSPAFVLPAIDSKHYEHDFPYEKFGAEHGYLIAPHPGMLAVRRTDEKITVISTEESFSQWPAYMLKNKVFQPADKPVFHNRTENNFVSRFAAQNGVEPHTKGELFRKVQQFGLDQYVQLTDVALELLYLEPFHEDHLSLLNTTNTAAANYLELNSYNWFTEDELMEHSVQRVLRFTFTARDAHNPYNLDILSFLLSQLQLDFEEYQCVAVWQGESP